MKNVTDKTVLLFYQDFERDSFFRHDRYIKRTVKPIVNRFRRGKAKVSGFLVWQQLLVRALREAGCDVRLNDYGAAKKNPDFPVGLVGYPHLLDRWNLPNPAVLGPGFFDHPAQAPQLMNDPRFRLYIVTCAWMRDLFAPVYGADRCVDWNAGIDLAAWPDTRGPLAPQKTTDVLIYDKVRWDRDRYEPSLIMPIQKYLTARGLQHETIRYGKYDHSDFLAALARARTLIFLCEHETQGMAYQEALASNVPVLAWDNGWWLDPRRASFSPAPVLASSVPYFGPDCGARFTCPQEFPSAFDRFWEGRETYTPRAFVARELSFGKSAETYLDYYRGVAANTAATTVMSVA